MRFITCTTFLFQLCFALPSKQSNLIENQVDAMNELIQDPNQFQSNSINPQNDKSETSSTCAWNDETCVRPTTEESVYLAQSPDILMMPQDAAHQETCCKQDCFNQLDQHDYNWYNKDTKTFTCQPCGENKNDLRKCFQLSKDCAVCLCRIRDYALLPCGHGIVTNWYQGSTGAGCIAKAFQSGPPKCPICQYLLPPFVNQNGKDFDWWLVEVGK